MKFEITPRAGALNCAYCLSEVEAEEGWTCGLCGVRLHDACALELERCPTVGCTGSPHSLVQTPTESRVRREAAREAIGPESLEGPREHTQQMENQAHSRGTDLGCGAFFATILSTPAASLGYFLYDWVEALGRTHHWSEMARASAPFAIGGLAWIVTGIALTYALRARFPDLRGEP